jgi:hypothetical protein
MPRIMELKNGAGWTNPAPQQVGLARRRAADWRGVRFGAPCVGWVDEQPCWGGVRGAILKNTRRSALAERFPHLVESVGISDTRDQMQVSDRLLIDRAITKIVDLGSGTFDLFFAVMAKIDFVTEARRQLVEQLFCSSPIRNRRPRALMLT